MDHKEFSDTKAYKTIVLKHYPIALIKCSAFILFVILATYHVLKVLNN